MESVSTIYGNAKRGTGILNNELYVGRLVWNRLRDVKNPDTGKRVFAPQPDIGVDVAGSPRTADRSGRPLDLGEVAPETDAACDEDNGRDRRGEAAAVPVLGTDEVRRLGLRPWSIQKPARKPLRRCVASSTPSS